MPTRSFGSPPRGGASRESARDGCAAAETGTRKGPIGDGSAVVGPGGRKADKEGQGPRMDALTYEAEDFDLHLSSGRVRAARFGARGPMVLCVPGLSANLRSFDCIAPRLAEVGFEVIVLDLRGRGRSETTPPGTYGWPAHAADVAEVAQRLGANAISVVGWSMGAFVGMQLVSMQPHLVDELVLIDACGGVSEPAMALVRAVVERLGVVHPSARDYLETVKRIGASSRGARSGSATSSTSSSRSRAASRPAPARRRSPRTSNTAPPTMPVPCGRRSTCLSCSSAPPAHCCLTGPS